ncbi:toxin-antitoxin system YwqK family antitoxin [Mucilaginibacter boryungensis]|uniref:MORN repeat protein n=1 Tax=Mucilaginibacter boryungensis TaxID=768480 RepID=A0ABR9XL57_9SPHI|nr:hypothetical protein [Mucilaginibacter boryungensis]MBE9668121.1 hypothetical protein [Mucilaginibacter boryungensis]
MRYCALILLLAGTVTVGCNTKKNKITFASTSNGQLVQRVTDEKGNLFTEQVGIKNGSEFISDGTYKEYYPNGRLRKIAFKANNLPDGNYYVFFPSGQVDSMNIKKGRKTYYSVVFDEQGQEQNEVKDFQFISSDTSYLDRPLNIAVDIPIYGDMTTTVAETLYHNGISIWDTSFSLKSQFPLSINSMYNKYRLMKERGTYKLDCTTTYIDNRTNQTICSQRKSAETHIY